MLLLLFMAMLPLKLINGQVSTSGTFYTSDDQVQLLSVAGNCVFECDNYPPCQTIKTYKNGSGCALVDEIEEKNYDVFSYVKKIANNPFDVPFAAAPNECVDFYLNCTVWASSGECVKNPSWMHANCKDSCGMCPAPIVGNWSAWTDTGACSVPCGIGVKGQTRSCDNPPPQHGGIGCSGSSVQYVDCEEYPCPTTALATTTAGPEDGTLNITDFADDYDTILAACGGALKQIDPNNPFEVMAAADSGVDYWVGVICPSTPDHATCNCPNDYAPRYYRRSDGVEYLFCDLKLFYRKGVCA